MVHLHRHSEYSRLDGVGTAEQYADRAAEMGQPALALTDHGTLSGALHHVQACRNKQIISISGVEAYYRPDRSIRDKDNRQAWHLCLLAQNLTGWHNLLRLTSIAYRDNDDGEGGFYQYPCMDIPLLRQHSEGIIVMSGCISSWLSHCIKLGDDVGAEKYLKDMLDIYGDNFWFEIQPHDFDEQRLVNIEVVNFAQKFGRPMVATTDAHAPYEEWLDTQQIAKMMSTKLTFKKLEKKREEAEDGDEGFAKYLPTAFLMSEKEVRHYFTEAHPDLPSEIVEESIENTHELVKTTKPFLLDRSDKLPRVSKNPEDAEKILRGWCEEGLERIGKTDDEQYRNQMEYELDTFREKGVFDYFVLTGDVVRWARSQGIRTSVRGSAAGCLVSYLIGIVSLDPIAWGLKFERFMNPGRKGLPDIDIDFDRELRGVVKEYVAGKLGHDHVADIIAHQTFQPNKVMIDVARVFDIPHKEVEELSKAIDIRADDDETTLEEIRAVNEVLDQFAARYPDVWKHALRLEGTVANASKHAAGVVISREPIERHMPLERGKKGDQVTSWSDRADFPAVSDHGFVKLDMLGLKGLTKQAVALSLIKERHDIDLNLDDLCIQTDPRDVDPEVMEIFSKGLTLGIWQFGSRGITNLVKSIKPEWCGDLAAANALYRPGPMGQGTTWEYADLKKMPTEELDIWHEKVQDVLLETYGIIAYQEQVMEVCQRLGGFSGGQADDMRKAMGKLYRLKGPAAQKFMSQFKETWDQGIADNEIPKTLGEDIWKKILSFGGYGFNKSHSASYVVQAYQDAYLKAYYPHEFYCALLHWPPSSAEKNAEEKSRFRSAVFREAEVMGVDVEPPDVNTSGMDFTLDGDKLRYGLRSIQDVGAVAAKKIIDERPFKSWDDFMERMTQKGNVKCPAGVRTALVESGACDSLGQRDEMSGTEMAKHEKARLGVALTISTESQKHHSLIAQNIHTPEEIEDLDDGAEVVVGGDVIDVRITETKQGKNRGKIMAFVTIAFGINQWRCTFWPEKWTRYSRIIEDGTIMISGRKDTWRGTISVVANEAIDIESWALNMAQESEAVTA